jgi:hypothetical protein
MSKISNVRLPALAANNYSPDQVNQLIRSLEQILFQLNNTYTPQVTEENQAGLDWFTGPEGPDIQSVLEDNNYFAYGSFLDFTDQTCTTVNTATPITWDTAAESLHVKVGTDTSHIEFTRSGRYYIAFTAQMRSSSSSAKNFWFWPRVNGTDITGSTMKNTLSANDQALTVARSGIFHLDKGDYLQAMWAVDDLNATLESYAGTAFAPATPSVTLMVTSIEYG